MSTTQRTSGLVRLPGDHVWFPPTRIVTVAVSPGARWRVVVRYEVPDGTDTHEVFYANRTDAHRAVDQLAHDMAVES